MAPITPHISEELWSHFGHRTSIHLEALPDWDSVLSSDDVITLVVQVNGRLRDRIEVSASITEEEAVALAKESDKVTPYLTDKVVTRVIYVPAKLVNIVV
jgi:leucyl-tRNA synthetase